ncbi:hypothetical protein PMIN01_03582 [Paraphaeosphaeria minitans]|uniref:Uncharacterized protein n=1 Tax=Paraphaeosphaeria minitans TaxID=565426 RepID=A0A9P6GMT3_9PLEO|nr:hypothetical protein PMIN01_03582 [Paraphaeosphaeria minitans]
MLPTSTARLETEELLVRTLPRWVVYWVAMLGELVELVRDSKSRERGQIRHEDEWEGANHPKCKGKRRLHGRKTRRQRAPHHQPGLPSTATRGDAGPSPYRDPILTMRAVQSDAETKARRWAFVKRVGEACGERDGVHLFWFQQGGASDRLREVGSSKECGPYPIDDNGGTASVCLKPAFFVVGARLQDGGPVAEAAENARRAPIIDFPTQVAAVIRSVIFSPAAHAHTYLPYLPARAYKPTGSEMVSELLRYLPAAVILRKQQRTRRATRALFFWRVHHLRNVSRDTLQDVVQPALESLSSS